MVLASSDKPAVINAARIATLRCDSSLDFREMNSKRAIKYCVSNGGRSAFSSWL
jgi:hypothetical protein